MPTSIQTGPENDQMTMSVARAAALLGGRRCTPKATEWRQQIRTSERQIQELASMSGHKSHHEESQRVTSALENPAGSGWGDARGFCYRNQGITLLPVVLA